MNHFFSFNDGRCLVSPAIGCAASCSYCYTGSDRPIIGEAGDIIEAIRSNVAYKKNETIFSLGCLTECLAPKVLPCTIEIAQFLLDNGHRVSIATKMKATPLLSLKNIANLFVFISCPTVSYWNKYEKGVDPPVDRLSAIEELQSAGISPVLYSKPFLTETPKDFDVFVSTCKQYKIDMVLGREFTQHGDGKKISIINEDYREVLSREYDELFQRLSERINVFQNSMEVLNKMMTSQNKQKKVYAATVVRAADTPILQNIWAHVDNIADFSLGVISLAFGGEFASSYSAPIIAIKQIDPDGHERTVLEINEQNFQINGPYSDLFNRAIKAIFALECQLDSALLLPSDMRQARLANAASELSIEKNFIIEVANRF